MLFRFIKTAEGISFACQGTTSNDMDLFVHASRCSPLEPRAQGSLFISPKGYAFIPRVPQCCVSLPAAGFPIVVSLRFLT